MGKRTFYQRDREYIDQSTGEVMEVTTYKEGYIPVKSTEHFIMTFIDFLTPLYNLKPETAKLVLMWMCEHAQWDTGVVLLTTKTRKEMCDKLNIAPQTLSNCLTSLKTSKMISGEKGEFKINPFIFWKGTRDKRKELIKDAAIKATFEIVPVTEIESSNDEDKTKIELNNFWDE